MLNYSNILRLVEKDRGIINLRKINDSPYREHIHFVMDSDDIHKSISDFDRNYGVMASGVELELDYTTQLFKINVPVILDNTYKPNEMITLAELGEREYTIFFIYINGIKIPNKDVNVFRSNASTDVLIPYQYVDLENDIDVYVETLSFRDFELITSFKEDFTGTTLVFNIPSLNASDYDYSENNHDKFLVYIDGALYNGEYSVTSDESTKNVTIHFASNISTSVDIEVYYNENIKYRKMETPKSTQVNDLLYINIDNYTDPIHGSLNKKSINFYVNQKRVPFNKVSTISRTIFIVHLDPKTIVNSYDVILYDMGMDNDANIKSRGSDYYIQKMIGEHRIEKYFKEMKSDSIFDDYDLNINTVVKEDYNMYNDNESYLLYDKIIKNVYNVEDAFSKLLERNPNIMTDFLQLHSTQPKVYNIFIKEDQTTDVYISLDVKTDNTINTLYNVYVNRKLASKYTITDNNIIIPLEYFNKGDNILEIVYDEVNASNSTYFTKTFLKTEILKYDDTPSKFVGEIRFNKSVVPSYNGDTSTIGILEKISYIANTNYIFATSKYVGYVASLEYEVYEKGDLLCIGFKTILPNNDILLILTNFTSEYNIIFNDDTQVHGLANNDVDSFIVPIWYGSENEPKPIVSKNIPSVYVNGVKYMNGIDFTYITPFDNIILTTSVVSFSRAVPEDALINIVFNEVNNILIMSGVSLPYYSKYGLMYFSELKFPFHTDYLNLFIDGERIGESDIDILSDKLIRVKVPTPFTDVVLETRFKDDYSKLEPYINKYKEDDFELIVEKIFKKIDYSTGLISPDVGEDPDDIYESFEDNISPDGEKVPNDHNADPDISRSDLFKNLLIKWLISYEGKTIIVGDMDLSQEVTGKFEIYDITTGDTIKSDDIDIDTSSNEFNFSNSEDGKYVVFDCNKDIMPRGERFEFILNALLKGDSDISTENMFEIFANDLVSNVIFPIDFPIIYNTKEANDMVLLPGAKNNIIFGDPEGVLEQYENKNFFNYKPSSLEKYKII